MSNTTSGMRNSLVHSWNHQLDYLKRSSHHRSSYGILCPYYGLRGEELVLQRVLQPGGLMMRRLANGWPFARGGADSISKLLAEYFVALGGQIETSTQVTQLNQLPTSRAVLFDTTPAQMLKIAGAELPESYYRAVKAFRHGPGVCKIDWALDGPIPWTAQECRRAGTVHVGGTLHSIMQGEQAVYNAPHIGGDIGGGAMNLWQCIARPVLRIDPYSTPNPRLFLCSASTPPGPGVHGMCGYHATRSVLSHTDSKKRPRK